MTRRRLAYYLINAAFILLALCFLLHNNLSPLQNLAPAFPLYIFLFLLIHLFKFLRMYFIILESMLFPSTVLKIYIKTAFVNVLLPFKTGELFKAYCYGYAINSYSKGIVAVLIEKFFDTAVLCALLLPFLIGQNTVTPLFIFLLLFLVIVAAAYYSFSSTYKYLNRFFIVKGGGKKSIFALTILENMKKVFLEAQSMIRGRQVVVILMSILAWSAEALLLYAISSNLLHAPINIGDVATYISDGFFGIPNTLYQQYTQLCIIVFLVAIVILYLIKFLKLSTAITINGENHEKRSLQQ